MPDHRKAGDDSAPPNLPEGWAWAPLGEREALVRQGGAGRPSGRPYLSLEHLESDTTRILGHGRGRDVNSTKTVFRSGDVLYGKLRPYLNKVCIPAFDGICSTDVWSFRSRRTSTAATLCGFLNQREVVEYRTITRRASNCRASASTGSSRLVSHGTARRAASNRHCNRSPGREGRQCACAPVTSRARHPEALPPVRPRRRLLGATDGGVAGCPGRLGSARDLLQRRNCGNAARNTKRSGRLWGAGVVPELTVDERESLPDSWAWTKVRVCQPPSAETHI